MTRTEVILAAMRLKVVTHRGRRAWLLCPFHQSPTDPDSWASTFFVRTKGDRAGNYHCFTCKESGSLTALVMHVLELEYKDAKDFVRKSGEGWRPPKAKVRVVRRPAKLVRPGFTLPREIVFGPLADWDTLPREYIEERGITPEEVESHRIGFTTEGFLACRVVFPVLLPGGKAVGYSARTFVDEEPRYKTPNEDDNADLDAFFGEHLWPAPGDRDEIIVTEGAVDKLAACRVTGRCGGSISGSDVRPGHIVKLATFRRVIVLTDPDRAGKKAARRLAGMLGRYVTTDRVELPIGKDAAVLAKLNPNLLRRTIDAALARTDAITRTRP